MPGLAPSAFCGDELQPLLPQLLRDMSRWELRSISAEMLDAARSMLADGAVRASLMIVNRTVFWLRPTGRPRSPIMTAMIHDLQVASAPAATAASRTRATALPAHARAVPAQELADAHGVPDVEFVLNVDDYPFVKRADSRPRPRAKGTGSGGRAGGPVPLLSLYQTRRSDDILAPGGSFREASFDTLMLKGAAAYEARWPWETKRATGFWQGHPYCGMHKFGRCSRYLLSHLSTQLGDPLLDVGLTFYEEKLDRYLELARCNCSKAGWAHAEDLPRRPYPLQLRKWVAIERHPRYKYLLNLDGHSNSWRLQFLLATNSAVLRQASYFWEYYHTGLRPFVHYVPFWTRSPTDVLDVLRNVTAGDERMRAIGRSGLEFAHRHLNPHARECYWRALLEMYARRLRARPSLSRWPAARVARGAAEGWHKSGRRADPAIDWSLVSDGWKREDDRSLADAVQLLETQAAGALPRSHHHHHAQKEALSFTSASVQPQFSLSSVEPHLNLS